MIFAEIRNPKPRAAWYDFPMRKVSDIEGKPGVTKSKTLTSCGRMVLVLAVGFHRTLGAEIARQTSRRNLVQVTDPPHPHRFQETPHVPEPIFAGLGR